MKLKCVKFKLKYVKFKLKYVKFKLKYVKFKLKYVKLKFVKFKLKYVELKFVKFKLKCVKFKLKRLFVVVGPDDSLPNDVTTSGGRPPRPHSKFIYFIYLSMSIYFIYFNLSTFADSPLLEGDVVFIASSSNEQFAQMWLPLLANAAAEVRMLANDRGKPFCSMIGSYMYFKSPFVA